MVSKTRRGKRALIEGLVDLDFPNQNRRGMTWQKDKKSPILVFERVRPEGEEEKEA
jgi:hypothetical protein